jgi:hypothetical protein
MACDIITERHVCLVNWLSLDDPADLDRITAAVQASHQRYRRPIVYVSRVAEALPPPSERFRKALPVKFPPLLAMAPQIHAVFEGGGFMNAVKIAALSAVVMIIGKRQTFLVHATAEELTASLSREDALLVDRAYDRAIDAQAHRSAEMLRARVTPGDYRGAGGGHAANGVH